VPRRAALVAGAVAVALCAAIALTQAVGADYGNLDCHLRDKYCDDAAPAIDSLIHGHVADFFDRQPLMGPVSLYVRAPVAALAGLGDYDFKLVYDLGALACMLALAAGALALMATMRSRGHPPWQQALAGVLLLVNPVVFKVLQAGHPEELLGTAACLGAGLAILARRDTSAGVLLGVALATKLWAAVIAPGVLLAADRRVALRVGVIAAVVTALLYAPMVAGDAGRFRSTLHAANKLGTLPGSVTSANVWWFVASEKVPFERYVAVRDGQLVTEPVVGFTMKDSVAPLTHPTVILLAAVLSLLWARGPRARAPDTLLLLFALCFLLRCIFDPGNWSYYHLPAIASLLAYESVAFRRPPWAAIWLMGCVWATALLAPHIHSDAGFGLLYLGWALPTAAGLALWLFRPTSLFQRARVQGQSRLQRRSRPAEGA
jgi:hypothetical protein